MNHKLIIIALLVLMISGCEVQEKESEMKEEIATFAGGCFWCTESDFEKVKGVTKVVSGYAGGHRENPTYEEVSSGTTGHVEAIQVHYNPKNVSYNKLLNVFWRVHDPTDEGGSFGDRGQQYTSVIFYHNSSQKKLAEASKKRLGELGIFDEEIATRIVPLEVFYEAEEYHQDYHTKNPIRYNFYRKLSGRDSFIKKVWTEENLKKLKKNE